jgi:methanogenic corrinoid protein MtbC1
LDVAVSFAKEKGIRTVLTPFHPFDAHVWTALAEAESKGSFGSAHTLALYWAARGDFERLEQLFLALGRSEAVSFSMFCDEGVRGMMRSVGEAWREGRMRVGDEHMVSSAVTGALLTLRREWLDGHPPRGDRRPAAVVGTIEGNHHRLGALCIRVLLERLGWEVFYPGADVPAQDFGFIQRSREASLVCVSMPPTASAGDVRRCLDVLRPSYDRSRPYAVVFGGLSVFEQTTDIDTAPFTSVAFLNECGALRGCLENGLGSIAGAA